MLSRSNLHAYQERSVNFIKDRKTSFMILGLSLGKTIITLTAIEELKADYAISKVLILAPLRVAQSVWDKELSNWEHLSGLTISKVLGTPKQRSEALKIDADIYITNMENVVWLLQQNMPELDMLVVDESSMFKSYKAKRFKALQKFTPRFEYKVLLTGTPSSKDIQDLFPQIYLLDNGKRLGKYITHFRSKYMIKSRNGFSYDEKEGSRDEITDKIKDITLSLTSADYLTIPKKIHTVMEAEQLKGSLLKQYKEFEKDYILELDEVDDIEAPNRAVLLMKLNQFCSGAIYKDTSINKDYIEVHDLKFQVLDEILAQHSGENILVAYNFGHELDRLLKRYPQCEKFNDSTIDRWNDGEIKMLAIHPKSAGHGINLQFGGRILTWLSPTDDFEAHVQLEGRIARQGQKFQSLYYYITVGAVEYRMAKNSQKKHVNQEYLINKLK